MATMNSLKFEEMCKNGKKYCAENFTFEKNMKVLVDLM